MNTITEKLHLVANHLLNPTHNITICLIGCGGTGSLLLSRLARMDYALRQSNKVGFEVMVFDNDIVEDFNVGRQMFSLADVGENKAVISCSKINRNFGTAYEAVPTKFNFKRTANLFITAVDNAQFRSQFDVYFKNACRNNKPYHSEENSYYWMDIGNAKNTGQCVLGSGSIYQNQNANTLDVLPTVIDRFPDLEQHDTSVLQGNGCSSFADKLNDQNLFINDNLSAMASHLLWEMLTVGYINKAGFFLNLNNLKTNPILL
jgi:PRTRC genetic system ThiF family protein